MQSLQRFTGNGFVRKLTQELNRVERVRGALCGTLYTTIEPLAGCRNRRGVYVSRVSRTVRTVEEIADRASGRRWRKTLRWLSFSPLHSVGCVSGGFPACRRSYIPDTKICGSEV